MYPLTGDYRRPIQAFIDRLNTHPGLMVQTNALATQTRSATGATTGGFGYVSTATTASLPRQGTLVARFVF